MSDKVVEAEGLVLAAAVTVALADTGAVALAEMEGIKLVGSDVVVALVVTRTVALPNEELFETSEANEEATLDRMLENCDAKDVDTLESVAVAATVESPELSDEAKLDSALEAPLVTGYGTPVAVAVPKIPDTTDWINDSTDETTLDASDPTEETMLDRSPGLVNEAVALGVLLV